MKRMPGLASLCASLAVLSGCASDGVEPAAPGEPSEVDPRTRWEQAQLTDYSYVFYTNCGERVGGRFQVAVRDGTIADVEGLDEPGRQLAETDEPSHLREIVLTVDKLWEQLDRAEAEADLVSSDFDDTYGYPSRIDIDWEEDAIDDEVCHEITDFVPE